MTKLHALLNFYNEPERDLVRCLSSLAPAGVEHVTAVDGRYALFPGATAASPAPQHAALRTACWGLDMGLTLHVPVRPWSGNEVEKRTFMHALALTVSGEDAWHLVIDADEVVDKVPVGLLQTLARTRLDVASVMAVEVGGGGALRRRLFRAQPLEVGPSHCRYVSSEGVVLSDSGKAEAPTLVTGLTISHRRSTRSTRRMEDKDAYYRAYSEGGQAMCERECGRPATCRSRTNWRVQEGVLLSDPLDTCQHCAEAVRTESRLTLRAMDRNPDRLEL